MATSGPLLEIYERRAGTGVATLAVAGFLGFVIGVAALHALRPDYNPLRDLISDYADGPYGYVLAAAFTSLGIGSLALLIGLRRSVKSSAALSAGLIFLGIATIGCFGAALFPTDPIGAPMSPSGVIHTFNALLSFTGMSLALPLLSMSFGWDDHWSRYQPRAALLASVYVATYGVMLYCLFAGSPFVGFANRLAAFALLTWLLKVAFRLRGMLLRP